MRVDWLNKWMTLNHQGVSIHLHGFKPSVPAFSLIELLLIDDSS
jgi:hypothetical protein